MDYKQWLKIFWVVIILLAIRRLLMLMEPYMLAIQGSIIISILSYPIYLFFKRKFHKQGLAAFSTLFTVFVIVLIPIAMLTIGLVNQASNIAKSDENYIELTENAIAELGYDVEIGDDGLQLLERGRALIFDNLLNILNRATSLLLNMFIFFFLMYYMLIYAKQIVGFIKKFLPFDKRKNDDFVIDSAQIIRAVTFGAVLTAVIQGILGGLGFLIVGLNSPLFWGFVMAVLSLLPLVGSWLVWGPAVIFLFITGEIWPAIILTVWGVIIVSQSDNLIKPIITSRLGKVHPVVILLGVFGGLALYGVVGILSGPIILGLIVLLVQYFYDEKDLVFQKPRRKTKS